MTADALVVRMREVAALFVPLPGGGETTTRHRMLMQIGREDLSLARMAEAHFDALSILAEAGRERIAGALYAVWASERPGQQLSIDSDGDDCVVNGSKMFCSGAGLVDRALVTVGGPRPLLLDLDLRRWPEAISVDSSSWKTSAFSATKTATVTFRNLRCSRDDAIGETGWYLDRPGFWHGACGPAACWAGGAAGLVDFARQQDRSDAHSMAHLGAMHAAVWGLAAYLDTAGREIDAAPHDADSAHLRALTVRHLVEQASTEILRRIPRAYGPHPLAFDQGASRRYQELDLYLRQSHAERDLEMLGRGVGRGCSA